MTIGDFSDQADAYVRSRPGYPAAFVERMATEAEVSQHDPVVEFGAGTGIFTKLLVDLRLDVTAIEPNAAMRNLATVQAANWVNGTFENSNLPDGSQQWAVAAQAFHWADLPKTLPEIRRILKPNRFLTVIWNDRANQDSEVLRWTEDAIRRHVPNFDESYRARPWGQLMESTGDFEFAAKFVERHVVTMPRQRYLDLWQSHNRLNNTAGSERFIGFFADLTNHLESNAIDQIDVPYNCQAWSARRK